MCRARESGAGQPEAPPDAWMLGMQAGGGDAHKTSTGYWSLCKVCKQPQMNSLFYFEYCKQNKHL